MKLNKYVTPIPGTELENEIEKLNADGYTVLQLVSVTAGKHGILAALLVPSEQEKVAREVAKRKRKESGEEPSYF